MTTLTVNLLMIDIGTLRNFVKVRGGKPKPKHRQTNSYKLSEHRKRIIFLESLFNRTEK